MASEKEPTLFIIEKLTEAEQYLDTVRHEIIREREKIEIPYFVAKAKKLVEEKGAENITASYLQRKFRIGYERASRLLDYLEE